MTVQVIALVISGVVIWIGGYVVGRAHERSVQEHRRWFRRTYGLPWR